MTLRMGDRIYNLLNDSKMSVQDLADECNISRNAVYKWLNNETRPSLKHLVQLSGLFNVDISEFF